MSKVYDFPKFDGPPRFADEETRRAFSDAEARPYRRAKDFVKCTDPDCLINRRWAAKLRQYPDLASEHLPHCHPVF